MIDKAGARQRHFRSVGSRKGFPNLDELRDLQCDCDKPCLADTPVARLEQEYNSFAKLSQEMYPQWKENRYLLDKMFDGLSNRTIQKLQPIAGLTVYCVGSIDC